MDDPVRITTRADGTLDVALYGDIDFANSPIVKDALRAAVAEAGPPGIRVDLSAVTFLDSSGIAVLVIAHRLAAAAAAAFVVEHASPAVYEHLRLTGLTELFGITLPGESGADPTG